MKLKTETTVELLLVHALLDIHFLSFGQFEHAPVHKTINRSVK